MLQSEGVSSFPRNTLFEVSSITRRSGEHGEYAELLYSATVAGKRKTGKVRVPASAMVNLRRDGPCLMFYGGTRATLKGRNCYDISLMRAPDGSTAADLRTMADKLRSMGPVGVKAAMTGVPLDNFEPDTLFVFSNPRMQAMGKDRNELLLVDFETGDGDETITGKLLMPARLQNAIIGCGSGLLLYSGPKKSQEGRTYHDVTVISRETASGLVDAVA